MQIIADTSGRTVHVPGSSQIPARGAALFGAVAAGAFPNIEAAIEATRPEIARSYEPVPEATAVYEDVYEVYRRLHDTLGEAQVDILHELKRVHAGAAAGRAVGVMTDTDTGDG